MSRKSTLSSKWKALADAVGSNAAVAEALGMSQTTFYRASRGIVAFPPDKRDALEILCDLYNVTNPLEGAPTNIVRARDLTELRMLGTALERGFPAATRTIERLRAMYPTTQLVELAESENTPETILRAVTVLLEAP